MMLKNVRVSSSSECRSTFFIKIAEIGYTFNPVYLSHLQATPQPPQPPPSTFKPPPSFFARPAEVVAPALIGCLLVKRQASGEPLWSVGHIYSQEELCH